ncbi:MAG: NAD(P)-dependent oxidoreductase [Verrucomicrobiota bacterium]
MSTPSARPSIAFVGLGRMGANMARRLHEQGYDIAAVHDRHEPTAVALAAELDAVFSPTLAGVTAAADIIFTVVTDDRAQRDVFAHTGDSLLTGATGKTFVNCATISPAVHVEIEAAADEVGAHTLEACMASSIPQARAGTLYLMCGGRREVFERLQPVLTGLSDAGKLLRYIGPAGTAGQVKALVNMVMNINTAGLAEGLGLGTALGLDPKMLLEVFSQTGAASRVVQTDGEDMVNRDHACFFSAAHAAKDSGIAVALAETAGLTLPLATATRDQYDRMVALGLGDQDKSAVAELTFPGRAGAVD